MRVKTEIILDIDVYNSVLKQARLDDRDLNSEINKILKDYVRKKKEENEEED